MRPFLFLLRVCKIAEGASVAYNPQPVLLEVELLRNRFMTADAFYSVEIHPLLKEVRGMASVQEVDLAGIGKRFAIETSAGDSLTIVVHDSGAVEIYRESKSNSGHNDYVATLNTEEARLVAAIIGRTIYRTESIERLAKHGMTVVWHGLNSQSPLVGKSLGSFDMSRFPTVSIVAVVEKGGAKGANPSADYVLKEDSQIAIVGSRKEIQEFIDLLEKGS